MYFFSDILGEEERFQIEGALSNIILIEMKDEDAVKGAVLPDDESLEGGVDNMLGFAGGAAFDLIEVEGFRLRFIDQCVRASSERAIGEGFLELEILLAARR